MQQRGTGSSSGGDGTECSKDVGSTSWGAPCAVRGAAARLGGVQAAVGSRVQQQGGLGYSREPWGPWLPLTDPVDVA